MHTKLERSEHASTPGLTTEPRLEPTQRAIQTRPRHVLLTVFFLWKGLLLILAIASGLTGPSYDTSTTLALQRDESNTAFSVVTRLTRWDAIYFAASARRGLVFEQEYAFGRGLPVVVSTLAAALRCIGVVEYDDEGSGEVEALLAVVVAHAGHLAAVLTMYELSLLISRSDGGSRNFAFLSSLLHIVSPAGLFLSAPYAESSFAFLSFVGYWLLARATRASGIFTVGVLQVAAGAVFGLATTFRTNGILNGIPFAINCALVVLSVASKGGVLYWTDPLSLVGPVVGGILVAAGSAVPQAFAYDRYCIHTAEPRPWCEKTIPSIYAFVQEHYWGTGFLRYWTLSNLPLFLLATPMLLVMFKSGLDILRKPSSLTGSSSSTDPSSSALMDLDTLVRSMALSQVSLAFLTLTSYHVQIITRLASGYPLWYWWLAKCLSGQNEKYRVWGGRIFMFMIMYAMIQGALFACFLPPA